MAKILIGNIKGPQGEQGPQGVQGPVGPQGPKGDTGPMPTLINNGTTTQAGVGALDAAYGKTLTDKDTDLQNQLNTLNGKKLLSKLVTIPITDQTIDANGTLRLVGSDGIYTTYDLLSSAEIGKGYKVMMVGNGTIRGNGTAINHIIPTYISFGDSALENLRLVNTHATGTAAPSAIILQVLAYTEGS